MSRVIVIEAPDDSSEDIEQFTAELAQGLSDGEYECTVTEAAPVLAATISEELKKQRQVQLKEQEDFIVEAIGYLNASAVDRKLAA